MPLHPIDVLEGVTKARTESLAKRNFHYIEDLLSFPPEVVAKAIELVRGITAKHVQSQMVPQARLMQVDGVDAKLAQALVKVGTRTYRELATANPKALRTLLSNAGVRSPPTLDEIEALQKAATPLICTSLLHITVVSGNKPRRAIRSLHGRLRTRREA